MKNFYRYTLRITHYTLLAVFFVAELNFQFLPKILHEIFGVALMLAIIVQMVTARRQFAALTKKITSRKFFSVTISFAMTICAAVIFASGVCMSNYLFADVVSFELRRNMTIHQLHVALPYVLMILIGVHIGLHWRELRQQLLNFFGATEFYQRWQKIFLALIVMLSAFGAAGLYLNHVGDRILMKHIFATPATELHGILFALMIVGGIIFFALITFVIEKKFFNGS